jgi:hypothetical protein
MRQRFKSVPFLWPLEILIFKFGVVCRKENKRFLGTSIKTFTGTDLLGLSKAAEVIKVKSCC